MTREIRYLFFRQFFFQHQRAYLLGIVICKEDEYNNLNQALPHSQHATRRAPYEEGVKGTVRSRAVEAAGGRRRSSVLERPCRRRRVGGRALCSHAPELRGPIRRGRRRACQLRGDAVDSELISATRAFCDESGECVASGRGGRVDTASTKRAAVGYGGGPHELYQRGGNVQGYRGSHAVQGLSVFVFFGKEGGSSVYVLAAWATASSAWVRWGGNNRSHNEKIKDTRWLDGVSSLFFSFSAEPEDVLVQEERPNVFYDINKISLSLSR